ncbi:hypothetical protein HYO65_gp156 [Tenacibaculum phage PTm1]|uniref:Uncharacterized protein n=2 Tax=Shirahamavirus PTm1 TaxID=2846435 RepID=A0A5S9HXD8_9CAUD|nr:hypothetical protein HYO65_gp156 [Tenacibaculum phage PTm1]BBI90548.1 hypothetical protein [Tenacibaculum phage PTm1]BBI90856.1 hypothetical protein [Tenacibaculum phage PTm5]
MVIKLANIGSTTSNQTSLCLYRKKQATDKKIGSNNEPHSIKIMI